MIYLISWWFSVQILGLAALPLALRWLRWLPDRGYFFAKPLGILLAGYLLWLGASFGVVNNTATTIALLAAGVGVVCWMRWPDEAVGYWRARWRLVLTTEVIFTFAFLLWSAIRAYNPGISATEKPMEIAFLSATLRSTGFPPLDPWLSGYGISYYYFGYVAMAMLAKLSGVAAPVAFNLSIALLFAMTVTGCFALGYNLIAKRGGAGEGGAVVGGLLTSLLVAISANLEGLVEVLNARALLSPGIWQWLQIREMPPPYHSASGLPQDSWWWFRAARVIMDYDPVTKVSRDYTINEFPYFSFLLGDLHPHVLALPFAVLAIAVALNLLYSDAHWTPRALWHRRGDLLLIGLVFGGLGFLNSWDMPAYLLVLAAAFGAHRYWKVRRLDGVLLREVLTFGLITLLASVVLYLPFYIFFRSQAAGIGLVVVHTKLQQFALFWGPLFFLLVSWLVVELRRRTGAAGGAPMPTATIEGAADGSTTLANREGRDKSPRHRQSKQVPEPVAGALPGGSNGRNTIGAAVVLAIVVVGLVLVHAEVTALLLVLLALGGAALWQRLRRAEQTGQPSGEDAPAVFVSLLVLVGLFLILVCEWVFIKDYFGNRMNTVFKLYYQAWLMVAVAGGYVLYCLAIRPLSSKGASLNLGRLAWPVAAVLVLAASLVYPVAATPAKTEGFTAQPTLDGQAFMAQSQPEDYEAIRWLQANVSGTPVILEATGGSYSAAGRVSAFTGLPTLLGWDFHELQWRGSGIEKEKEKRKADVDTIYTTRDRALTQNLLREYGVTYVYVGPLERETYAKAGPAALEKFAAFMDVAYQSKGVTIYRVRQ